MPSSFDTRFLATAAPRTLALSGESVTLLAESGTSRTITATVDYLPERTELREGRRLRIASVEVCGLDDASTGLGGVTDGWGLTIDNDPVTAAWDFTDRRDAGGGMIAAIFERTSIIDTGTPQPADI